MEKKLKISLEMDDKAFQQGVKRAMDQLNQLSRDPRQMQMQMQLDQRLRAMGYGGLPGAPGYEKTVQERKRGEQEQKRYIEDLLKSQDRIIKNEGRLTNLKTAQLKAGKDIKETEKTLELLGDRKLKNEGMLTAATERRVRTYRELLSNMEKEFKLGGMGGIGQAWSGMSGAERAGFGATTAGGLIGALGMATDYMGRRNIDIAQMQGSAVSMMTGRQLREARTGEYTFESMYGNDRQKAGEEAKRARSLGTKADWEKLVGGAAIAAGALLAIPTGGLSVGAGLGVAGLAGGLAGTSVMKGILDPGKYSAYRSQQEAQDFTTMLEALHEKNPYRKNAIEMLKTTGARDIGMQRTLGLNDKGYYNAGGYLQPQMGLGFTDSMITQASQDILGAGGSTAMARKSGIALQAERGLNLTNASQLLGQLSGTQSIPEVAKKSLIDIFAHGFDNSKFAEENRKYMQTVTEQIYKGGTSSTDAADAMADIMRKAIGETPTVRGIEAGKSAFQAFNAASTATSGYLGGINVSSAMDDKYLSKIKDPWELQGLIDMPFNEIEDNDPELAKSAAKMGLTGPQLAAHLRSRKVTNLRKAISSAASSGVGRREAAKRVLGAQDIPASKALLNILDQPETPERDSRISKMMEEAQKAMESQDTGKMGDRVIQASAINARTSLETLSASINKFADDAMTAAKKLSGETAAARSNETAHPSSQHGTLMQYIINNLHGHPLAGSDNSKNQKQAN